ncbi:MAG: CRISPR system precrRNA processing endoribonuclease RAMP protein Cas6 [Desulfobacterales bacterium]|nr:CRISPR system precrRNA processing endoribonuclease RAMP protein Cas6 [Desulfobacterales bacterium]
MTKSSDLSPSVLFGDLPLLKLRFLVQVPRYAELPKYTGSAWLGIIGLEMQHLVCPFDLRPVCKTCTVKEHCSYFLLIEKQTPLPGFSEAPRGYIFYSPVPKDNSIRELFVTLIGSYSKFLSVVVKAVLKGRSSGIGKERYPYEVVSCEELLPDGSSFEISPETNMFTEGPQPLREWLAGQPEPAEEVSIRLVTPVRLRRRGDYLDIMDWAFYFGALARRMEALNRMFHGGELLGKDIWLSLQEYFQTAEKIRSYLRWLDLAKYSGRQKQKTTIGGLVGKAILKKPSSTDMEWWKTAELLHVGKDAAMGLGKIEIG